ncbi:MAG: DUF493 domain-containing protein [Lentisphaeria bacterium]|nr:DUF493 domain-containing protein [Lentisphaeria bacterium]
MTGSRALQFPRRWEFRLFVYAGALETTEAELRTLGAAAGVEFALTRGESSAGGKYRTVRAECGVESLEQARELAAKMGELPGVRFMV